MAKSLLQIFIHVIAVTLHVTYPRPSLCVVSKRSPSLSEIVDVDYQDAWEEGVIFQCGDASIHTTVAFKQWNTLFIATDPLGEPFRGQGRTKEEAALEYLKQKLAIRDS